MARAELKQLERELEVAAVHFTMAERQHLAFSDADLLQTAEVSEARVVSAAINALSAEPDGPVDELLAASSRNPMVDGVDRRQWAAFLERVRSRLWDDVAVEAPDHPGLVDTAPVPALGVGTDPVGDERREVRPRTVPLQPSQSTIMLEAEARPEPADLDLPGSDPTELDQADSYQAELDPTELDRIGAALDRVATGPEGSGWQVPEVDLVAGAGPAPVADRSLLAEQWDDTFLMRTWEPGEAPGPRSRRRRLRVALAGLAVAAALGGALFLLARDNWTAADQDCAGTGCPSSSSLSTAEPAVTSAPGGTAGDERAGTTTVTATTAAAAAAGGDEAGDEGEAATTSATTTGTSSEAPGEADPADVRGTAPTSSSEAGSSTSTATSTTSTTTTTTTTTTTAAAAGGVPCPGSGAASSHDVIRVASDDVLNVRAGPGTDFDVVVGLAPDTTGIAVYLASSSDSWVMVAIPGASDAQAGDGCGWVHSYYLGDPS